jgi:hypothetical protein
MLTRGMASSPRDAEEVWPPFVRSCSYDVDPRHLLPLALHLLRGLSTAMCDGGSSLDQTRAIRAIAPLLSEMSWRGRYFARELAQVLLSGRLASEFQDCAQAMASVMPDIFRQLSNAPRAEGRDAEGRNAESHAVLPRDDDFGVVVANDDDDSLLGARARRRASGNNFGWIRHQGRGGGGGGGFGTSGGDSDVLGGGIVSCHALPDAAAGRRTHARARRGTAQKVRYCYSFFCCPLQQKKKKNIKTKTKTKKKTNKNKNNNNCEHVNDSDMPRWRWGRRGCAPSRGGPAPATHARRNWA